MWNGFSLCERASLRAGPSPPRVTSQSLSREPELISESVSASAAGECRGASLPAAAIWLVFPLFFPYRMKPFLPSVGHGERLPRATTREPLSLASRLRASSPDDGTLEGVRADEDDITAIEKEGTDSINIYIFFRFSDASADTILSLTNYIPHGTCCCRSRSGRVRLSQACVCTIWPSFRVHFRFAERVARRASREEPAGCVCV